MLFILRGPMVFYYKSFIDNCDYCAKNYVLSICIIFSIVVQKTRDRKLLWWVWSSVDFIMSGEFIMHAVSRRPFCSLKSLLSPPLNHFTPFSSDFVFYSNVTPKCLRRTNVACATYRYDFIRYLPRLRLSTLTVNVSEVSTWKLFTIDSISRIALLRVYRHSIFYRASRNFHTYKY